MATTHSLLPRADAPRGRRRARPAPWAGLAVAALACLLAPSAGHAQTPYLGELRLVSFNFPPKGWAFCDGQLLSINQNQALFALLGTTYGGNGTTNFALPDLRGRVPLQAGPGPGLQSYTLGQTGGQEFHTLTLAELPPHTHVAYADSTPGSSAGPSRALPARNAAAVPVYSAVPAVQLAPTAIGAAGGGQAHENRPPTLTLHYIIALQGIFPSQSKPGAAAPAAAPALQSAGGSR